MRLTRIALLNRLQMQEQRLLEIEDKILALTKQRDRTVKEREWTRAALKRVKS